MKRKLIIALFIVALTGCSKNINKSIEQKAVEAKFSKGVITRTVGNEWIAGDQIGVFMTESDNATIVDTKLNVPYKAAISSATSSFTPVGTVIYLPHVGDMVDFYAYYPYSTSVDDNGILKVDVSSGIGSNIDILRAKSTGHSVDKPSATLQFKHRLAQLTMNITRGSNISTSAEIAVNIVGSMTAADYNIFTDKITNLSENKILSAEVNNDVATVIIVPQTMESDVVVLFTVEGKEYRWEIGNIVFNSGDNYSYNIEIIQNELKVSSATITPWINSPIGTGNAE